MSSDHLKQMFVSASSNNDTASLSPIYLQNMMTMVKKMVLSKTHKTIDIATL